jgi:hypothetical protein
VTASTDWLSGNRPPLPRREKTPIFDDEFAGRLDAVLNNDDPVWPGVDPDAPTVEFRPVKPPRWSRRWWRENLSGARVAAAGASGAVLLWGLVGRWFM